MPILTDPTGLGIDIDCGPNGLSPTFGLVAGLDTLGQALYHRFTTARDLLSFHLGDGKDLRASLSDGFTPQGLTALTSDIEQEALKDERVDQCQALVKYNAQAQSLTVQINATPKDGSTPFKLTLLVTQLGVELLNGV